VVLGWEPTPGGEGGVGATEGEAYSNEEGAALVSRTPASLPELARGYCCCCGGGAAAGVGAIRGGGGSTRVAVAAALGAAAAQLNAAAAQLDGAEMWGGPLVMALVSCSIEKELVRATGASGGSA